MPRRQKKDEDVSIITEFMGQLRDKEYLAKAKRGEDAGIWEVEPVDITTFITSPDYLGQSLYGLSDAQYEALSATDDFENGINYIVLWIGKGGGKDWITRMIFMRLAYKLLCMRSPHRYFGMPEQEYLTFLNVAASSGQAQSAFFEPLKGYFRSAGEKAFKHFGFDPDVDIMDKEIKLPKNINIVSGHSEADSLEGRHLIVAVADEIDGTAFKKPDKMWTMLRSSSRSRYSGKEKILAISYSRYGDSNGMIEKLYNQYKDAPNARVFKYASWEFNPNPNLTRESLESEYLQNPEEAECIYGCNPPTAALDAFIKDHDRIQTTMEQGKREHPLLFPLPPENFHIFPMTEVTRIQDGNTYQLDPYNLKFKPWFKGKPGVDYMFVGDPGLGSVRNGGDAYGIAVGHRQIVYDDNGKKMVRPVVDFMFRFTGYMFSEREVQFDAIKRLIIHLKEELGFNLNMYSFDLWNSADIVQWIRRRYGSSVYINKERKYVRYDEYNLLRQRIFGEAPPSSGVGERMNNGGIDWYYHPIVYWELKNLIEDRVKNKVDHQEDTSKDMVDPICSLVWHTLYRWPSTGVEVSAGKLNSRIEADKENKSETGNSELDEMLESFDRMARDLRAPTEELKGY